MAERDYERSDVSPRAVVLTGGVLCLAIALIGGVLWLLRSDLRQDQPRVAEAATTLEGVPPRPRLQESPQVDLRQLTQRQRGRLTSWGWIDKPAGVAHIPVEAAMALMVDRGWPDRERVDVTRPPPPPPPRPFEKTPGRTPIPGHGLAPTDPPPDAGPTRDDETRGGAR